MPKSHEATHVNPTERRPGLSGCRTPVRRKRTDASKQALLTNDPPISAPRGGSVRSKRTCRREPSGRSPSRNARYLGLRAAQCGKAFAGFTGNQRFQSGANQSGLFLDAGEFFGAAEQTFVDD